jgi:multiple sugar transport system ATP-binding protein
VARVEFEDVWKQFASQGAPAVRGLSLDIADGELLVLLGPSGCGKTTALRMLAGLEEPDRGDIRIAGTSVVGREPKDRDVALVFQSYALYPHLSARENIRYPLKLRKMSRTRGSTTSRTCLASPICFRDARRSSRAASSSVSRSLARSCGNPGSS